MPKGKVQVQSKPDEDSQFASIIAKSYSDFATLVAKSYFPRFTEPSKGRETPVSKEKPLSTKSSREPKAS